VAPTVTEHKEGKQERKPEIEENGDVYIIHAPGVDVEISKERLRELKRLYCEQRLSVNQLCREMELPRPEFWAIKSAFGITHDDVPYLDEDLEGHTPEELAEESLERRKRQYYVKLQAKEIEQMRAELKKYREQEYIHTQVAEKILPQIAAEEYKRPTWLDVQVELQSEKAALVCLSDWHRGKLVWGWELITGNEVNKDIYEQRVARVLTDATEYCVSQKVAQAVVVNLGDGPDGPNANIYPKQAMRQWEHGEQQVFGYYNDLVHFVKALRSAVPVERYYSVIGNHSGKDEMVNWDALTHLFLAERLKNSGVRFDTGRYKTKAFEVLDSGVVILHGESIRRGKTASENATLSILRMYGMNRPLSYVFQGHVHHLEDKEQAWHRHIMLPSIIGGDDLAENVMYTTSRPAQIVALFSEGEGLTDVHYIYLD
jgi:hypothetical protein